MKEYQKNKNRNKPKIKIDMLHREKRYKNQQHRRNK